MDKKQYVVFGLIIVALCVVSSFLGWVAGRFRERQIIDEYALVSIASRLQVVADWENIREYVYCDVLLLGDKWSKIETKLAQVGPFTRYDTTNFSYTTINFDEYFTGVHVGDLYLVFDEEDRLDEILRLTNFGDTISPYECP